MANSRILCLYVFLTAATGLWSGPGQAAEPAAAMRYAGGAGEAEKRAARLDLPSLRTDLARAPELRLEPLPEGVMPPESSSAWPPVAGRHRELGEDALNAGRWQLVPGAGWVWRLSIHSPGAAGLRVHFRDFAVNAGRVWVHDGSREEPEIQGPYSGQGPYADGQFWSGFVLSDSIVVEFEPDSATPADGPPPFRIAALSHLFPGALPVAPDPKSAQRDASARRSAAASCNLDVSCYPEWTETAKSVGHIVYEEGGSTYVCSGTLLNTRNSSGIPYFLTADHCVNNDPVARTVQAFWFYQTQSCGGQPVDRRSAARTLGARYLAGAERNRGDFSLLRLNEVPAGVVFAGWDPRELPVGAEVIGIHHPRGDYKRISFGTRAAGRPAFGADPDAFYSITFTSGVVEGGSSGSGIFTKENVLAGVLSHGPKVEIPEQICAITPLTVNYGRFSAAYPVLRDFLEERTTGAPPPPSAGGTPRVLTSGEPQDFSFEAVPGPTLFRGSQSFQISVPQGATRLEIRLATATANVDVDLFARVDSEPEVANGSVAATHSSTGPAGNELIAITPASAPPLRAGTYYIALAVMTPDAAASGSVVATVSTGVTPPPASGSTALVSGAGQGFALGPVTGNTLFNGSGGYTIQVPQGATRLEIRVDTATPGADVDLYARFGTDTVIENRQVTADHRSESSGGDETITITATSSPPLRPGTYYISLGLFTAGLRVTGTITATVSMGTAPPPGGATPLTSGVPRNFAAGPVSSATLFNGRNSYTIQVPPGATRLEIRLTTATAGVDIDLFARYERDVAVENRQVVADHESDGPAGTESIAITTSSTPPLRPGTYYIALGLYTTGVAATGTITATVTAGAPPAGSPSALTSGVAQSFTIGPVTSPTLLNGSRSYTISVPPNATRLEIRLSASTPSADVDLFARYGQDIAIQNREPVSDHNSTGPAAEETIVITSSSTPPLRPGAYYIALALYTTGVTVSGSLTATVTTGGTTPPPPGGTNVLTSGVPRNLSLAAVSGPTLMSGSRGYRVVVPEGATRLDVRLAISPSDVDVDLFLRHGSDPAVVGGRVQADHDSSGPAGEESISITANSTPPLRPGTYYIALAVFTTGRAATGTLTATVTAGASPPPGAASTMLVSGTPREFTIGPVANSSLFYGPRGYFVDVPQGATRLEIQLSTATSGADVDLYARFGADVALSGGSVVADHVSNGPAGEESIVITASSNPPLRPGPYYIALGLFTLNASVSGTLRATVSTAAAPPFGDEPTLLTSGRAQSYSIGPYSDPMLINGNGSYVIEVPENAARLDIQLTNTTPGVDVDLFARYEADTTVFEGRVIADHESTGPTGGETITISPSSSPPLRSGRYYISLAIYTTGAIATGNLTATVTAGATPPAAPAEATLLQSGVPAKFNLPAVDAPVLFNGAYSYRINVPEGASSLRILVNSAVPAIDVDLYARYESDVAIGPEGEVLADYGSEGDNGNELLLIRPDSVPPLRPGVYYISLALYTRNAPAAGSLTAVVERSAIAPPVSSARPLTPGTAAEFTLPAVTAPTLFTGERGFRLNVPPDSGKLDIVVLTETPGADVDLFVRYGAEPDVVEGRVVADHRSTSDSGNEIVSIGPGTSPPLRPGMYFVALGLYTPGAAVNGSLMAVVTPADKLSAPSLLKQKLEPKLPGVPLAPKPGVAVVTPLPDALKGERESVSGIVKLGGRPSKRKSTRYRLPP